VTRADEQSAIARLGVAGGFAELRSRIDVARSTGLFHAWRRFVYDIRYTSREANRRDAQAEALWRSAAAEVGASVARIAPGVFLIRRGQRWTRVVREAVMLNDFVSVQLAANKPLVHRLLLEEGIRRPDTIELTSRELESVPLDGERTWVVKPAKSSGGKAVTSNVRRFDELRRAAFATARYGPRILAEHQVKGDVYRVLLLDGEILDIVRMGVPRVTGNGAMRVGSLILAENERRLRAGLSLVPLAADLDCLLTLKSQGLNLRSIIPKGAIVQARTVTNQNAPEDNETVREAPSPELCRELKTAAAASGLRLAAVDVVAPDLSRSLSRSRGVVLEINGVPGLHHHYRVKDPSTATNVAVTILERLLD